MASAVAEFQLLLVQLTGDLGVRVAALLAAMSRLNQQEALAFATDAYPELLWPYLSAAADLTATWYEEQPGPEYSAVTALLPDSEKLSISARWALLQSSPESALQGSATRAVFTASRDTVITNAEIEDVRWARHASANACAFCRLLATRGAVYKSQQTAQRAHDHCHCLAVPDRDGTFEPAPYVEQWMEQYIAARDASGSGEMKPIVRAWEKALRS